MRRRPADARSHRSAAGSGGWRCVGPAGQPGSEGQPGLRRSAGAQKVSFQLLSVPVSWEATSWTRSFQVPFAVSLDAFTE